MLDILDIKETQIKQVGRCYQGFKCAVCQKPITRKVYNYHLKISVNLYCSKSCAKKGQWGRVININDDDSWLLNYKTYAPNSCKKRMKISSCLDCKDSDCSYTK